MKKGLGEITENFYGALAAMHDIYLEDGEFDAASLKIMGDAFADLLKKYKELAKGKEEA